MMNFLIIKIMDKKGHGTYANTINFVTCTETKKLLKQYGDQLVCIRYRYNSELKKRFKTVELIIEEFPWIPKNGKGAVKKASKYNRPVSLRIGYRESELRDRMKSAGGKWDSEEKVWILSYRKTVEFGLESRILRAREKIT